jgi:hypothetical protein
MEAVCQACGARSSAGCRSPPHTGRWAGVSVEGDAKASTLEAVYYSHVVNCNASLAVCILLYNIETASVLQESFLFSSCAHYAVRRIS